ncbi:MAG: TlpA disulfide reductase family protein [Oleiphilaceae bacterium]|nr:TlpA disulfide reductase family protein [Oleiphilaceae bacterium]
MRLSRFIALVLTCSVLLAGCSESPQWRLNSGEAQSLKDVNGQWLLFNYWAEWCAPCIKEIPELNELDEAHDITVYGYNFDRLQGDKLTEQASKLGIAFALMRDEPAPIFGQATPKGLPATLVVTPQGEVQEWLIGPQTVESVRAVLQ